MKKRLLACLLGVALIGAALTGCTAKKSSVGGEEKVVISVGGWTAEGSPGYEAQQEMLGRFNEKYPQIEIEPDYWGFDLNTFLPKAASGQLPSVYITSFTEIKRIISTGYASEVTKYMKKYKYTDYLRDDILKLISDGEKIYSVPQSAYVMALYINMNLFEQAGLVNPDGTPMIPKTWEELAQYGQVIREKTGQAGFIMPTIQNCGGWHFINMAWAYGSSPSFVKSENGKWKSDFANPQCAAALQYVKDLRWKYNIIPSNAFMEHSEMLKQFAANQAAMFLGTPPQNALTDTYKMDKSKIAVASMPAGPAGKFSQMGGTLRVLKNGMSDAQIDACFKWMQFSGCTPDISEDTKKSVELTYKNNAEFGRIVGIENYSMWKNVGAVSETQKFENDMIKKYTNVDTKLFADFADFDALTIIPEPPVSCQQLYSLLDGCLQAAISDKNSDPNALLKKAASDYQVNYLDKD